MLLLVDLAAVVSAGLFDSQRFALLVGVVGAVSGLDSLRVGAVAGLLMLSIDLVAEEAVDLLLLMLLLSLVLESVDQRFGLRSGAVVKEGVVGVVSKFCLALLKFRILIIGLIVGKSWTAFQH